ncbi:hypothetical protein D1610_14115 [Sphingomonas gilva]|uniref:HEAT repeat domain-containing protein n=1 Tax=Sphingomonas gilva TaxID=2305907 RepID=A0A396RKN5_9SPHN|nr:hypothetical protein [Sphingomonas gilva]RHW16844.1 hypothetical protein D1610_14115 [Sphingomonas gilva]
MGFKVDSSFLRYLTMGARGTRQVIAELEGLGFEPIELERYCTSNKIWATKVKRLRLPDLICVKTGLKVEVRAKSALTIKMSDAPANPDRVWDAGAEDEDVVAFIACRNGPGGPFPADHAAYFDIGSLRRSARKSILGPAKSASEGAERDRTWPSTVPKRSGTVLSVTRDKLLVQMEEPARKQSFNVAGRNVYVAAGDRFEAGMTFLAGVPDRMADLSPHLARRYDPVKGLRSARAVDRYAAAKAVRFRPEREQAALPLLERALKSEREARVALEVAGTATALGLAAGQGRIADFLWSDDAADLSMEAILILTEIGGDFAREQLAQLAADPDFEGDERRQAAIWGLGKAGVKAYHDLLPYLNDADENVAFHAIAAFGHDTPRPIVQRLVRALSNGEPSLAPAASEALRVIGGRKVLEVLVKAIEQSGSDFAWGMATLGRLEPKLVREGLRGSPLLAQLEPMLLMAHGANWLTAEDAVVNFAFLLKQDLYAPVN